MAINNNEMNRVMVANCDGYDHIHWVAETERDAERYAERYRKRGCKAEILTKKEYYAKYRNGLKRGD